MDPKVLFDRPLDEELLRQNMENANSQPDLYGTLTALAFVFVGIVGIWLHGVNVSRLLKLDSLLPPGCATLHFHLALACLGVVAAFPFGAISTFYKRWVFGSTACQIYAFEGMLCGMTTIALTCAISGMQCLDLTYGGKVKRWHYHLIALFSWIFGLVWAVLPLVGFGKYTLEAHQTTCTVEMLSSNMNSKAYLIALTLIGYVIPLSLTMMAVRRVVSEYCRETEEERKRGEHSSKLETFETVTKLNVWILLHNIMTWLPLGILAFWNILVGTPDIDPRIYYLPQIIAKLGCATTPLGYLIVLRRLQNHKLEKHE